LCCERLRERAASQIGQLVKLGHHVSSGVLLLPQVLCFSLSLISVISLTWILLTVNVLDGCGDCLGMCVCVCVCVVFHRGTVLLQQRGGHGHFN